MSPIQRTCQYIGHFHIVGNPGRHQFDDTQERNYKGICDRPEETAA
jgi:hydroxypyruvate isomerase